MASPQHHIALARSLPGRLQRFFAYNPPQALSATTSSLSQSLEAQALTAGSESAITKSKQRNPFSPHKNPATSRWHPPLYSLRQQAELVKLARNHGVEDLLPFSIKSTQERTRRREESGLLVKGTGVGQRVKGHEWERTLKGRLEKRRQAMLDMPNLVREWKEVSHRMFRR